MLRENVSSILKRMSDAAARSGRSPDGIKLVAVTKTVELEKIREAFYAGLRIFGENRVQEAQKKIPNFRAETIPRFDKAGLDVEWHLIGHLQKNKAKYAVQMFNLIHAVDSAELAGEINRQAEKINKIQRVLVEVKLSEEESKHGVSEQQLIELLSKISGMNNLQLEGLMTIPPFFEDPGKTRPYFSRLKELGTNAEISGYNMRELSMGMSNDFEVAIEEGSTMVRIGTAIFGERSMQ
jgi:pyridoxal phosphate enzyme (YggS family)